MRIAALYDIHGNLPALEAVLEEIARVNVEMIVIGGDVVAGPMPGETLARLLTLPIPVHFVRGNADREVLAHMTGSDADAVPAHVREITRWVAHQLPPAHAALLAGWPLSLTIDLPGLGQVLFCHATPRSDSELFTRLTPAARLAPIFEEFDAAVVVCGHTHMQFDRTIGSMRVVNAGSVGMPYGEPGAYWLLLDSALHFRRTAYERKQAATRILATGYPQAEDFVAHNLLHLPSEAEALDAFSRMEQASDKG